MTRRHVCPFCVIKSGKLPRLSTTSCWSTYCCSYGMLDLKQTRCCCLACKTGMVSKRSICCLLHFSSFCECKTYHIGCPCTNECRFLSVTPDPACQMEFIVDMQTNVELMLSMQVQRFHIKCKLNGSTETALELGAEHDYRFSSQTHLIRDASSMLLVMAAFFYHLATLSQCGADLRYPPQFCRAKLCNTHLQCTFAC